MRRCSIVPVVVSLGCVGCGPRPTRRPETAAGVDVASLRAAIRGAWSTYQPNDTTTIARTLDFIDDDTVLDRATTTGIDGTTHTSDYGAARYAVTETGSVAIDFASGRRLRFTAIVLSPRTCELLHGYACQMLTWDGYLAQTDARDVYRREYEDDGPREPSNHFSATLRWSRSPCRLDLDVDGHRRTLACEVTPAALGSLSRLDVVDFPDDDRAVRRALAPALFFDPDDPEVLHFERPTGMYHAPP